MGSKMITLKLLADNYYSLFKGKQAPKVRHNRILTYGDNITFQGSSLGSKGLYTLQLALEKDPEGKVSFTSPVADAHCTQSKTGLGPTIDIWPMKILKN